MHSTKDPRHCFCTKPPTRQGERYQLSCLVQISSNHNRRWRRVINVLDDASKDVVIYAHQICRHRADILLHRNIYFRISASDHIKKCWTYSNRLPSWIATQTTTQCTDRSDENARSTEKGPLSVGFAVKVVRALSPFDPTGNV